jgi:hypothetical protein
MHADIVEAATRCTTASSLAVQIAALYKEQQGERPTLRRLLEIAEAMISSGKVVLMTPEESAASKMLARMLTGCAGDAFTAIAGRTFEDDVEACDVISQLIEAQTDAYPRTAELRDCVAKLATNGVITITDSAMAG